MATPNIVPRADSEGGIGTSSKYWASAYIDNVYVSKIGRDADNLIDFSADNQISIRVNAANELKLNATSLFPVTSDGTSLGQAANQWSDLFLASGAVINFDNGNVTLTHTTNALNFADNDQLKFGTNGELRIYHDGSDSYIQQEGTGDLYIWQGLADNDIILSCDDGSGGNTPYITIDGSTNRVNFAKPIKMADSTAINVGAGLDLRIEHNGTNSYIENHGGDLEIQQLVDDKDIIFKCDDGSGGVTEYFRLDGGSENITVSKRMAFIDNAEIYLGTGSDFYLWHNGSNTYMYNNTGDFVIQQRADNADITFGCDDGAGGVATYFYLDGSSATHDGSATTALYTNWPDYSRISLGTSHDMLMYHDSSQTVFQNKVGNFYITQAADDLDIIFQCDDGSGGTTAYLTLDGSNARTEAAKPIRFLDTIAAQFGTGLDMQVYHSGGAGYIEHYTGNFNIIQHTNDGDIVFQCDNGSGGTAEYFRLDGSQADGTFVYTQFPDSSMILMGNSNDLVIGHNATNSTITNYTGNLEIQNNADDKDIKFICDDGSGGVETYFFLDGSESVVTFPDDKRLTFGTDRDLFLYHTGSEAQMKNYTGQFTFTQEVNDGDIVFKSDDGSGGTTAYLTLDGGDERVNFSKNAGFGDDVKAMFGDGLDLRIFHNATDSKIENYVGNLTFQQRADDKDILFQCDDGSGGLTDYMRIDGSHSTVTFADNIQATFGTSRRLSIKHDGTDGQIMETNGDLNIVNTTDDKDIVFKCDDGSGGTTVYFRVDGSITRTSFFKHTIHNDNVHASFGDYPDLNIYHDGSNSYILHNGDTGNLVIQNSLDDTDIILKCDDGSGGTTAYITLDGSDVSTIVSTIKVMMPNLPTSNPSTAGQLWNDSGTLKISAG